MWVVKKKLGTLRKGFERKKEKGISVFQGYTKNKACNTQVFLLSGKEALLTH